MEPSNKSDRLATRTHAPQHKHTSANAAVLVIDMISDFDFEGADTLFEDALNVAKCINNLKQRANERRLPVIYVNDNYGKWKNDFSATLEAAKSSEKGAQITSILLPGSDDYHILKPQRSGFFATPLGVLLEILDVSDLIITGVTTDICILFTAHDAYMRGFSVHVPADCTAAMQRQDHENALTLMSRIADARVENADALDLSQFHQDGKKHAA